MSSVVEVPAGLALAIVLALSPAAPVGAPPAAPAGPALRVAARVPADFGFSDEAWLAAVLAYGREANLGEASRRIFRTSAGKLYVPVQEERLRILALRRNTAVAARIAAAMARSSAAELAAALGRPIAPADVYAAHAFGREAAKKLLLAAGREPERRAAEIMPAAAQSHPELFFSGLRPRSVAAVRRLISRAFDEALQGSRRGAPSAEAALKAGDARTAQWLVSVAVARP